MSFAQQVEAAVKRRQLEINNKIVSMAAELFTAVVDYSPKQPAAQFSKGEFINNWRAAVGRTDTSTTKARNSSGLESRASIAKMTASSAFYAFMGKDGHVTLSNSVSYAELVEYKGWPKPEFSGTQGGDKKGGPYAPVRNAFIAVVPKFKVKP
jgi:hypothetical protein